MTWADLLDDYEARITALEGALASGTPVELDAFVPPATVAAPPTAAERQRFDRLHTRAGDVHRRLVAARDATWGDIGETRRRARAARAYGAR